MSELEEIAAMRDRAADFVVTWASQFPAFRFVDVDGTPDNALMRVRPAEMNELVAAAMAAAIHGERSLVPVGEQETPPSPAGNVRQPEEHPCPDCGNKVFRQDYAMDPSDYRCWDDWDCRWESETPPPSPSGEETT